MARTNVLIFLIGLLLINVSGSGLKTTITNCCMIGENLASSSGECTPYNGAIAGIPAEQQSVCLSTVDVCCARALRSKKCKAGINVAKSGRSCMQGRATTSDFDKDCCEACKVGLVAGSTGQGCDASSFAVGPPWDSAYERCCTEAEISTPSSVLTTPLPALESLCDSLPGELCAHICVPTPGSFVCKCRPGYELMADRSSCQLKKNRSSNRCDVMNPCDHQCIDTGVAVQCRCDKGFELGSDKTSCNDINECLMGLSDCHMDSEICVNTEGSYTCVARDMEIKRCPPGYEFNYHLNVCDDIDECKQNKHDCNLESQFCLNTRGNFTCQNKASKITCPAGFKMNSSLGECEDIDECESGGLCVGSEFCVNEPGGYRCEPNPKVEKPIYPFPIVTFVPRMIPTDGTTEMVTTTVEPIPTGDNIACPPGYRAISPMRCDDVDECEEGTHDCDHRQDCFNTIASYDCRCKIGFQMNPTSGSCEDVNECQLNQHGCSPSHRCDNSIGSYHCIRLTGCGTGYTLNSETGKCEDDDECVLNNHNCHLLGPKWQCRNTAGSFRCEKKRTFVYPTRTVYVPSVVYPVRSSPSLYSSNQTLTTSTETTSTTHSTTPYRATTHLRPVLSLKKCFTGYRMNTRGQCEDINECIENNICTQNERCVNTEGGYHCEKPLCPKGQQLTSDGTHCEDIDECATGTHSCGRDQICINRIGGYMCQCAPGHIYNQQNECEDINECERFRGKVCISNSECINTIGSFRCDCKEGFRSKTDTICEDIDECTEQAGICDHQCINLWGSYRCSCKQGYLLNPDNRTCEDIDECTKFKDHNLCVGICTNTPGSYTCRCPEGYRLGTDGRTCQDIDECEGGTMCRPDQICYNMRGTYRCNEIVCPPGYTKEKEYKNRCKKVNEICDTTECNQGTTNTISFNYITFVSNLPIPRSGSIDLFTMRGPHWNSFTVQFTMEIGTVRAPAGVTKADNTSFRMTLTDFNQAVVSLEKSIEGPQDIDITLTMNMYYQGMFKGSAVAKLFVFVTQYSF